MISEESCDSEDCNDAEFDCILYQINAGLVNRRHFYQKLYCAWDKRVVPINACIEGQTQNYYIELLATIKKCIHFFGHFLVKIDLINELHS